MAAARYYLNPCMFSGIVYLCGATSSGATLMEAFSPETDTFLPVQITVPENGYPCLYVDNNLLVVHLSSYILKYAMGPDRQLIKQSEIRSPSVNKWQNSQPVIDKAQGLFFIDQQGPCLRFNMETGAQVSSIPQ